VVEKMLRTADLVNARPSHVEGISLRLKPVT